MGVGIITSAVKNIFVALVVLILFPIFLTHNKIVSEAASVTLSMCFIKLIPSIFPFLVLSGFLINAFDGNNTNNRHNLDKRKTPYLIIVLSWLSGFIVGPKFLCENSSENDITPLIFLCSNAGVGFVISYVGVTLWGSLAFGIYLFFIQIFWSVIIYLFNKNKTQKTTIEKPAIPLLTALSRSVQSATKSMLDICGFTVFFSILMSVISSFFDYGILTLTISSSLEISSGVFGAVAYQNSIFSGFFTGFTVGFGGICMCMQTFAVCGDNNVNKQKFILLKLLHGILCGSFAMIFVLVADLEPLSRANLDLCSTSNLINAIVSALFLCSLLFLTKKYLKNKLYSI